MMALTLIFTFQVKKDMKSLHTVFEQDRVFTRCDLNMIQVPLVVLLRAGSCVCLCENNLILDFLVPKDWGFFTEHMLFEWKLLLWLISVN